MKNKNIIIKIYRFIAYIWSFIIFVDIIGAYICVYNIEPLDRVFIYIYSMSRYVIDVDFYMILIGIVFFIIALKNDLMNFKEFIFTFCPNIFFALYIVWYLHNV